MPFYQALRAFKIFYFIKTVSDSSSCTAYLRTADLSTSFQNWNTVCRKSFPYSYTMCHHTPDAVGTDGIQNCSVPSRLHGLRAVLPQYYCRLPDSPSHCNSTSALHALQTESHLKHSALLHSSGLRYSSLPPASVENLRLSDIPDFHCSRNCNGNLHSMFQNDCIHNCHHTLHPTVSPS